MKKLITFISIVAALNAFATKPSRPGSDTNHFVSCAQIAEEAVLDEIVDQISNGDRDGQDLTFSVEVMDAKRELIARSAYKHTYQIVANFHVEKPFMDSFEIYKVEATSSFASPECSVRTVEFVRGN